MERNETMERKVMLALTTARTAYLYGRAGIGKTYAALNTALRPSQLAVAVTLTPSTQVSELRGQYHLRGGETVWRDGAAIEALTAPAVGPCRLILNELPNASDEALAFLYPLLESPDTASVCLPDGRVIRGGGNMQVIATGNESLDMLPPNMRDALRDRVQARVEMSEPFASAYAVFPETWRPAVRDTIRSNVLVSLRGWVYARDLVHIHGLETVDAVAFAFDGLGFDSEAFGRGCAETITQIAALAGVVE